MTRGHALLSLAGTLALLLCPLTAQAQTEIIIGQPIGADTQLVFSHISLPGATGIDFSFAGGFSPTYPASETHTVVYDFEWGPTATGPWTVSPDNVSTVPGGITNPFSTGIFHGPDDAPFVALHFYAGGIMFVSGSFVHTSVVPEPSTLCLAGLGLASLLAISYRRRTAKLA